MKKPLILLAGISLLTGITALSVNNQKTYKLEAYTTSSLPSTINLNDTSDNDIRAYYSGLNSLNSSERTGTNLLKNLKPILSNGQKYYSYDSK